MDGAVWIYLASRGGAKPRGPPSHGRKGDPSLSITARDLLSPHLLRVPAEARSLDTETQVSANPALSFAVFVAEHENAWDFGPAPGSRRRCFRDGFPGRLGGPAPVAGALDRKRVPVIWPEGPEESSLRALTLSAPVSGRL